MIESGLRAAGGRTGLFTSPHLAEPTERIRISGRPVGAEEFTAAFEKVHQTVEQLLETGSIDFHTTYFETVAAMAFLVFAEASVDRVVLEVGLGGRLDATNVVHPELCVITPIDFDHEAFLGKSLQSIAGEKAGILKPGVPAVFARQRCEVDSVLSARAAELAIPVARTADWDIEGLDLHAGGSRFILSGPEQRFRIECPLPGEHQVENAATAAVALHALGVSRAHIETGIAQAHWPGRLQRVARNPDIILDGAHNPAGARALAAYIRRFYPGRRIHLIFGSMRDKAVEEIGGILFPLADRVILTAPQQARAFSPQAMARLFDHPGTITAPGLPAALALVSDIPPQYAIFITGSLFLVAEALALWRPPAPSP
jgi:dihydrofolate synthase/folylpolyglutamate synthase